MELCYSPWMRRFLASVASAKNDILLVSPFIKLSLVKPLLLALPTDRSIHVRVVTRLSPFTFQQMASDLDAIELLLARPGTPGITSLYRVDRLHAKIYVFDQTRVILGSSNMSISGMERNLEAVLWVEQPALAGQVMAGLDQNGAFKRPVSRSDLGELRARLGGSLSPPERVAEADVESDESDLTAAIAHEAEAVASDSEALPTVPERQEAIRSFLVSRLRPSLNSLAGVPFESPQLVAARSTEQPPTAVQMAKERAAAERDLLRLTNELLPVLGIRDARWRTAGLSVCVHQTWCNVYSMLLTDGLSRQAFGELGKRLVQLRIATHFAKQIAFSTSSAGLAAVSTSKVWSEFDFESALEQKGLNILLHVGDVGELSSRERFQAIAGLLHVVRGPLVSSSFLRAVIDENIATLATSDALGDPKNRLQAFAQSKRIRLIYRTTRVGGSEHEPMFESTVRIGNRTFGPCQGNSKRRAEVEVALLALHGLSAADVSAIAAKPSAARAYRLSSERAGVCAKLAESLGFLRMGSLALLDVALTHASFLKADLSARSYQRLAFVGSFVGQIAFLSSAIRSKGWLLADVQEHMRLGLAVLEKRVFPEVFDKMKFGNLLRVDPGRAEAPLAASVKVDVIQAFLAVAFLWEGFDGVERFWQTFVADEVAGLLAKPLARQRIDPVSLLQQRVVRLLQVEPVYAVAEVPGSPKHDPEFVARVLVDGIVAGTGRGRSKKNARHTAAEVALRWLDEQEV